MAFAALRLRHEDLLGAIAEMAVRVLQEFNTQSLTYTGWAFATPRVRQEKFLCGMWLRCRGVWSWGTSTTGERWHVRLCQGRA